MHSPATYKSNMNFPCCPNSHPHITNDATADFAPEMLHDPVCLASLSRILLDVPLPALDDPEGDSLTDIFSDALPHVVDAHVHVFNDKLFQAIWRWFFQYGWPIRYMLRAPDVVDFLQKRGVRQMVGLHYAHKAGIADEMNQFVAALQDALPHLHGVATVFPSEPHAAEILQRGFDAGLCGVKIHCHVQCISPDDDAMHAIYQACVNAQKPLVMHAGREPSSPAYKRDPYDFCSAWRVEKILQDYPTLQLCIPHLGADEFTEYSRLLNTYDNLWLDTTMMLAAYFPFAMPTFLLSVRPERILYGSDFPNLPYAWDREIKTIAHLYRHDPALRGQMHSSEREEHLARLLGGNAQALFQLPVR